MKNIFFRFSYLFVLNEIFFFNQLVDNIRGSEDWNIFKYSKYNCISNFNI